MKRSASSRAGTGQRSVKTTGAPGKNATGARSRPAGARRTNTATGRTPTKRTAAAATKRPAATGVATSGRRAGAATPGRQAAGSAARRGASASTPAPARAEPVPGAARRRASPAGPRGSDADGSGQQPRGAAQAAARSTRHFREALENKRERDARGPAYPHPTAPRKSGRAGSVTPGEGDAEHPPKAGPPGPAAQPSVNDMRGRGNQPMRPKK